MSRMESRLTERLCWCLGLGLFVMLGLMQAGEVAHDLYCPDHHFAETHS